MPDGRLNEIDDPFAEKNPQSQRYNEARNIVKMIVTVL